MLDKISPKLLPFQFGLKAVETPKNYSSRSLSFHTSSSREHAPRQTPSENDILVIDAVKVFGKPSALPSPKKFRFQTPTLNAASRLPTNTNVTVQHFRPPPTWTSRLSESGARNAPNHSLHLTLHLNAAPEDHGPASSSRYLPTSAQVAYAPTNPQNGK